MEVDYSIRSETAAALFQLPGSHSSTHSAPSDMETPICAKATPRIGRENGVKTQLALAIAAAVIGSSFQHGYNTGVVNAPQKLVEEWIRHVLQERSSPQTVIEQREVTIIFSVFVAIFCVGGIFGGCVTGYVADRYGRKGGLLLNVILVILSCSLQGTANFVSSYEMLILGRFLIGINSGLNAGLAPMYVAEISPVQLRGAMGTVYQLVITISILLSQFLGTESILGTEKKWPLLFALSVIPAIFQLLILPFCPESPKYLLLHRNNEVAARRALVKLRGSMNIADEVDDIKNECENLRITPHITITEIIFNPTLRIPLTIVIMIMMGQQFSGINAIMFYSTKIFEMSGMNNENARYATLVMGLVNVGMTVVSLVLVEKAGRKTLLLIGFEGMCIVSILLVICFTFMEKSTVISYLSIALVTTFVIMFATGPGSIPWFLVTELFNQAARPVATSIAVSVNWTANFMVGLGFLPLQEVMKGYVFVVFAVLTGILTIFIRLKVPETKNMTPDEISSMFRQRSYK